MAPGGSSNKRTSSSQLTPTPSSKRQRADEDAVPTSRRHFQDTGIWKEAPVLTGSTKFPPLEDCKNILVTGGAGFIACWLVRHLTLTYAPHYNIISFDKLDYCASLNNTRCLNSCANFTFVRGDITSPVEVQAALRKYNVDTIFHFAAQSHVDLSFGNSYEFTNTNVYGTHVLLECAKNCGTLKRFIHVSTDEVYGEVAEDGDDCKEGAILAPTNPYAASKAAAEMLVHSYWKSFKLPIIIVRSNNIYGPHQFPEKIIPKFTLLLSRQLPLFIHGDGLHTRRYLFASDSSDAFDTILHRGAIGSTYNVGSTDEISNLQLCTMLLSHFGHDTTSPGFRLADYVQHTADRPFNDRRYAVDATRLRELGWRPKVAFEDGLRSTVEWYREFGERWWGDVGRVVGEAFPTVRGGEVVSGGEVVDEEGGGVKNGVGKEDGKVEKEVNGKGKIIDGKNGVNGVVKEKKGAEEKRTRTDHKKHVVNGDSAIVDGKNGIERKHSVKSDGKNIDRNGVNDTNEVWKRRNSVSVNSTRVQV